MKNIRTKKMFYKEKNKKKLKNKYYFYSLKRNADIKKLCKTFNVNFLEISDLFFKYWNSKKEN